MKIYKSYKELEGKTLKFRDILHFKAKGEVYEYGTMRRWLYCFNLCNNDIIFDKLNIKDRHKFCSESYGYEAVNNYFAYCHCADFEALTRLALDLFKLCDNYEGDLLC